MKEVFYLTKKEIQLILFIRNELPFGRGVLITHNGEPQRIEQIQKTKLFTEEKLDKNLGTD